MKTYAAVGAVIAWFALILQFVLLVTADSALSVSMRAINFFSYFTILSNILVALTLSAAALSRTGRRGLLSRPGFATAVAVYITITGGVYFAILRTLWNPEGWQFVADALLHYVTPVFYLIYWVFGVPKGRLSWSAVLWFLAFPVVYVIYSLVRGPVVSWYPYPFIDVGDLGFAQVLLNAAALTVIFLVVGAIFVLIDRLVGVFRPATA